MKRKTYYQQKTTTVQADNVLNKAIELLKTNQEKIALQTLDMAILGPKRVRNWSEIYEALVSKYLEICVSLRKGQDSKLVLVQYRSVCNSSGNMDSFLSVTENLVELAENRVAKAQKEVEKLVLSAEAEVSEDTRVNSVSGQDYKNRLERSIVEPWFKFLWDTYRNSLDVLKNSTRLESKYQVIAQKAFAFCQENKRRTEFRKLSELLRTHSIGDSETSTALHIATKFKQLNVGCELELWQDAYKTVEELNQLLKFANNDIDTIFLINYYEQLVKIFWVSKNYLFHAHASFLLYELKEKELDEQSKVLESSYLLLSILAIPDEKVNQFDLITRAKQLRMAPLLGSAIPPTKERAIEQWNQKNFKVIPELSEIYKFLQVDFHPLKICSKMSPVLDFISNSTDPEISKYKEPLLDVTVSKFITQLSKVYKTIRLEKIEKLVPFMPFYEVEKLIVQRKNVVIDHSSGILTFEQTLNSTPLKDQLEIFAKRLNDAYELLNPVKETFTITPEEIEAERQEVLCRRRFLERMKRWEEEQEKIKEEEKQIKLANLAKLKAKEDEERREKEAEKREAERKKREEEQKREMEAQKILAQLEAQTLSLKKHSGTKHKSEKKKNKSVEEIIEEKKAELEREQLAKEKRLAEEAKNIEYLEIIKREAEIPLIKKAFEEGKKQYKIDFETNEKKLKEEYERKKKIQDENKEKLKSLINFKSQFVDIVMKERETDFESKQAEWQKQHDAAKAKWEEKRAAILQEIQKRKAEEEEKRIQQEKEEKEKREKEEKIKQQLELQRQKEEEIERKLEEERKKKREQQPTSTKESEWKKKPEESSTGTSRWGGGSSDGGSKYGGGSSGGSRWGRGGDNSDGGSKWGSNSNTTDGGSKYGGGSSRYGEKESTGTSKFGSKSGGRGYSPQTDSTEKKEEGFETVEKKTKGGRWK